MDYMELAVHCPRKAIKSNHVLKPGKLQIKFEHFIGWNAFENIICKMWAMLVMPECIDDKSRSIISTP